MDAATALAQVTLFALDDNAFRAAWEKAVRTGADAVCAQVVGGQMAGRTEGDVEWDCQLPVPHCMDEETVDLAYRHAVRNVALERLGRMTSQGGLG